MKGGGADFCPVCREIFMIGIYSFIHPIDKATPDMSLDWDGKDEKASIYVLPMKPRSHALKVKWYLKKLNGGEKIDPYSEAPREETGMQVQTRSTKVSISNSWSFR